MGLGVKADSFAIHLASRQKPPITPLTSSEAITPLTPLGKTPKTYNNIKV